MIWLSLVTFWSILVHIEGGSSHKKQVVVFEKLPNIFSLTEKIGPTKKGCLEPMVAFWTWPLDQV